MRAKEGGLLKGRQRLREFSGLKVCKASGGHIIREALDVAACVVIVGVVLSDGAGEVGAEDGGGCSGEVKDGGSGQQPPTPQAEPAEGAAGSRTSSAESTR